jgi:gamma-glutamylcyclotransferase (GGCT)/AIG2-like uncharacterized protein YtfP
VSDTTGGREGIVVAPASLNDVLGNLNRLRDAPDANMRREVESLAETLFGASRHLIAYGSLAPGARHEGETATLTGEWHSGWVTGTLVERGWGASLGYPALVWHPAGERRVAAHLLVSPDLPQHWERLDAFEGETYRRILAPFYDEAGFVAVGNLYEAVPASG